MNEASAIGQAGFIKTIRGIVKQFIPYGMERQYILTRYNKTEPWDPSINHGFMCTLRDLLPYGLVRGYLMRRYETAGEVSLPRLTRLKLFGLSALKKLHLLKGERYHLLRDYFIVDGSGLFDASWYLAEYPDVGKGRLDPVWHYCSKGWLEGRSPGPYFDGSEYLQNNQDVASSQVNPVVHFVLNGSREGRRGVVRAKSGKRAISSRTLKSLKYHPKVSVIVASYNYEKFLPETLDSVLAQTYRNFEVIIVDDGSADSSVAIAEEYVKNHANVFLYRHEGGVNRGLPATVKLGLSKANGEFVAFCESDDMWMPDHLAEKIVLLNSFAAESPAIIVNDVSPFGDEGRCRVAVQVAAERMSAMSEVRNHISALDFRQKNWICTFSCCMVRRRALLECDFDSCPRPANLDWWLWRQVCCVHPIYVVPEKLTKWRMHESFMANESMESILLHRQFLDRMDRMLLKRYPSEAKDLMGIVEERDRYSIVDGRLQDNRGASAVQPSFSVILPTYNRAFCVRQAIDSLLRQTYQNFELIVVDDGSSDDTENVIRAHYGKELKSGKIKYLFVENGGVCKARNHGLRQVSNDWVAYLDSDNELCTYFLETFVREIVCHPDARNFYARLVCRNSGKKVGRPFDFESLLKSNFIDLGVYVHHRSLIDEVGMFDENMTRFVDWEFIVRQSKTCVPRFIDDILLLYDDSDEFERITTSVSRKHNLDYFRRKHCNVPTVTTVITTYNHEKYIKRALESAVMQKGEFIHEILVSDDGSTDQTRDVIRKVMDMYPGYITDVSGGENLGISGNMRKCFGLAKGDYVAVLEGDDYWISEWKLNRQVRFMRNHPECSMCFSRIKLLNPDGKFALLPRQAGLPAKVTGEDFIRDPNQNLIANFSCCMFKGDIVRGFPDILYSVRFNEIACAFYIEQRGPIGFLPDIMSAYRIHDHGVWSACDRVKQLEDSIKIRKVALAVAAPRYQGRMQSIIERLEYNLNVVKEIGHEKK